MKAIIMAGGEGTRLRPLTCDCPKPMIRLMNRPVMRYALRLLKQHGIVEIGATLGYQPDAIMDAFGDGGDDGVNLRYFVEKAPLGTAGGVKRAATFLDETFIVLSGDGVTDLDVTAAVQAHRRRGALATLVLKRADNPLEYGVVSVNGDGRVDGFREKPDWSDVVADTVNTGIYILEPEVLERIPEDRPCDFGHDLFPALLRDGAALYGFVTEDYWCDIGDIKAYLAAHLDAMEGRIRLEGLIPRSGRAVLLPGARVDRSAVLEGPCVIGPNARVEAGAAVGPYSVVGADCVVGPRASLKRSVLWPGARLEAGAQARGCVLGTGAVLGEDAQAYEESALGTGATAGARSVILPGVKLWPGKRCPDGARLDANLVWGSRREMGFRDGALSAEGPAQALRAAAALAAALRPREALLARSDGPEAQALWLAAASGMAAQGVPVLDAGACPLPALRHVQQDLGCPLAVLVTARGLLPLDDAGARLLTRQQRTVSALCARQDYAAPFSGGARAIQRISDAPLGYAAWAARLLRCDAKAMPPLAVYSEDESLSVLAERALLRAGLTVRRAGREADALPAPGEIGLILSGDGEVCDVSDAGGALLEPERELLCAWTALELGERTLLLNASATRAVPLIAERYGADAVYLAGESTLWASRLAHEYPTQFLLRFDGIAGTLRMLSTLVERGLTLDAWRRDMPVVYRRGRTVPVAPERAGRVMAAFSRRERGAELGGGVRFERDGGWAWLGPDAARGAFRVVAESASAEFARELCDFCAAELTRLADG